MAKMIEMGGGDFRGRKFSYEYHRIPTTDTNIHAITTITNENGGVAILNFSYKIYAGAPKICIKTDGTTIVDYVDIGEFARKVANSDDASSYETYEVIIPYNSNLEILSKHINTSELYCRLRINNYS